MYRNIVEQMEWARGYDRDVRLADGISPFANWMKFLKKNERSLIGLEVKHDAPKDYELSSDADRH